MNDKELTDSIDLHRIMLETYSGLQTPLNIINGIMESMVVQRKPSQFSKSLAENIVENYIFKKDFQFIGGIWFRNKIKIENNYLYFAHLDEDDIVQDINTGEIILLEFNSIHKLSNCAESIDSFFDVLSYLNKISVEDILNDSPTIPTEETIKERQQILTSLAGGEKYSDLYNWLISY